MKSTNWNTYKTRLYTYDVAQDQASAGGVHHHQVRKAKSGWETRILQTNGTHEAAGKFEEVSDEVGRALFEQAKNS